MMLLRLYYIYPNANVANREINQFKFNDIYIDTS